MYCQDLDPRSTYIFDERGAKSRDNAKVLNS